MSTRSGGKAKTKQPEGPVCPKCGSLKGWTGPSYQQGRRVAVKRVANPRLFITDTFETVESLVYSCVQCGYQRHEACNDYNSGGRTS